MTATIRASIVGTTKACVTASRRASASQSWGSNRGSGTTRRPAYVEDSTAATPAMWKGGTETRTASWSSAAANSTVLNTYAVSWSCASWATFGAALVPLVKSSTAGVTGSSGNARPASAGRSTQAGSATTAGASRSSSARRASSGSR